MLISLKNLYRRRQGSLPMLMDLKNLQHRYCPDGRKKR
jgi:hypothetical protein